MSWAKKEAYEQKKESVKDFKKKKKQEEEGKKKKHSES